MKKERIYRPCRGRCRCVALLTFLFSLVAFSVAAHGVSEDTVVIHERGVTLLKGASVGIFKDQTNRMDFQEIRQRSFSPSKGIPNFGFSGATYWLRFSLKSSVNRYYYLLKIENPNLDSVTIFMPDGAKGYQEVSSGIETDFEKRKYKTKDIQFQLLLSKSRAKTFYLKIRSKNHLFIPIYVGTGRGIVSKNFLGSNILAFFLGIVIIMIVYNLFLYFSTRDKNQLFYTIFLIAILYTQICLKGIGYQYLWHESTFFTRQSIILSGAFSGIATIMFTKSFLDLRLRLPVFNKIVNICIGVDLLGVLLSLFSFHSVAFQLINFIAISGCLVVLFAAIKLVRQKYRPAIFFFLAFSFFLLSVVSYVLRLYGALPFNLLTKYLLLIGSTIEISLLSFALADKINYYRKAKETSQKRALWTAWEKERFIGQQNVVLEEKVRERTKRLVDLNEDLSRALEKLKNAQTQLVEAEKMSSLGQLTAGIAHEINNPINFVKSNVKPLALDVEDLLALVQKGENLNLDNFEEKSKEIEAFKEEIDLNYLLEEIPEILAAIEDGAKRTTDIVQGLRSFSRLDEDAVKKANLHEGLDRTLILLKGKIPGSMKIHKDYGLIPEVECFPGKLNQVFMNILSNAIQAMIGEDMEEKEYILSIRTYKEETHVIVEIEDTGKGMPQQVIDKIFEPFFTTKDVGEGTGLGLAISYSIIEEHHGRIEVSSEEGKGTRFKLILPILFEEQEGRPVG